MKIKHTFTLYCLPFTLALFLVSCGTSGDGNGGESFEASDVSAANCADAAALNCFISQWDTRKTADGASYTNTIVLPLVENGEYDFYVDWGDETAIENITEFDAIEVTHTYAEEGEYTIHIAGEIKGWRFFVSEADNEIANSVDDFGDAVKLLDVRQWGTLSLGNTDGRQFQGTENFNPTASDAPTLSETTSLFAAFKDATIFNGAIGNWDVSTITTMESMFFNAAAFDQDLTGWDVSAVTTMQRMFAGASTFNSPLVWADKTQNVASMQQMFWFATAFNQNIGGWNVSSVTIMESMFEEAAAFDKDLSGWNVCKVTDRDLFDIGTTSATWTAQEKPVWDDPACSGGDNGGDGGDTGGDNGGDGGDTGGDNGGDGGDTGGDNGGDGGDTGGDNGDGGDTGGNNGDGGDTGGDNGDGGDTGGNNGDGGDTGGDNGDGGDTGGNNGDGGDTGGDNGDGGDTGGNNGDGGDTGGDDGGDTGRFADVSEANCADVDAGLSCFISVWNTEHVPTDETITGFSDTKMVKLPLVSEGTYDFYVDWGDGKEVEKITTASAATHEYATPGVYTVHIAGTIKGWRFFVSEASFAGSVNDFGDAVKLLDVSQWGSLSLGNTAGRQFRGAENFNPTATDAPDVSETTSLISAFYGASSFNADISDWDVSKVTNMIYMFNLATSFNNNGKPLDWGNKTSKVTSMKGMFASARAFNQDIGGWNVSNVTTMNAMFFKASSFNNKDGEKLDWGNKTSNVTDMGYMFNNAKAFNQVISDWDVENVRSYDGFDTGSGLIPDHIPPKFRGENAVSQELCGAKPELNCFISTWNTANVPTDTKVTGYSGTMSVKLPLVSEGTYNFYVNWGDGEVEKIEAYDAPEVTHNYDESGTYTIHIAGTIKGWRFYVEDDNYGDAAKLLDVKQWGSLSLGNTAGRQFLSAENFNPTATDAPDLSETTSLTAAFARASSFNGEIGNWDVSKVTDMSFMFQSFNPFNQDVSDWDVGNVTNMVGMFNAALNFNNDGKPLNWGDKTSNVTSMASMFWGAEKFNQDISGWDVSKVSNMQSMFYAAGSFNNGGKDLKWEDKTRNVTDMETMFSGAYVFNQDIGGWHVGKVTTMAGMFEDASVFNQNISGWNVANVTRYNNFASGSALRDDNKPAFRTQ